MTPCPAAPKVEIGMCWPGRPHRADSGDFAAGHLLPQRSAAGEESRHDWSSSADTQTSSVAGMVSAESRNADHGSSDLAGVDMSAALPALQKPTASTSAEQPGKSRAADLQPDALLSAETIAVSPLLVLQKPERRTLKPEHLSAQEHSASAPSRGPQQRAVDRPVTPEKRESAASSGTPYVRPPPLARKSTPAGSQKRQPPVIPHVAALGALVGALARASELDQALQLYKQVRSTAICMSTKHACLS